MSTSRLLYYAHTWLLYSFKVYLGDDLLQFVFDIFLIQLHLHCPLEIRI